MWAENPVRDTAVTPGAKEPQQTHAYSLDEIRTMLSVLPEPAATIFAVAAFTGLRRGKICGLRWHDYRDGEINATHSIWEGHTTDPKTFQSRGAVPVIKPVAKMLEAHRIRCGSLEADPVFAARNGMPVSLNNVLTRLIKPRFNGRPHFPLAWVACSETRTGKQPVCVGCSRQDHSADPPTLKRQHHQHVLHQVSTSRCGFCDGPARRCCS